MRAKRRFSREVGAPRRYAAGLCVALSMAALPAVGVPARAQSIGVTVNGQPVAFQGVGPQMIGGRVLVPVRGVLEKLGANVAWIPQNRTVVASNANIDIQLKIGDRNAVVNGKPVTLDVPAEVIAGYTMVPLRFLGEALGGDVGWNGQTKTVQILTKDQLNASANTPDIRRHAGPEPTRRHARPVIDRLTQNASHWLHAGSTLRVAMDGTPGGQASFRIPGVVNDVSMQEERPGHYVGDWQVPADRPIQVSDAAVIGSLRIGDATAPLLESGQMLSIDSVQPRVRDRAPEPDSRVTSARPNIYAVFQGSGSGIDPHAVRLLLNGQDVTPQAEVNRDFISYTPSTPLPPGPQTVELVAADRAGNRTATEWKFMEEARGDRGIRNMATNANRALGPGDVLSVQMNGTPGGRAVFNVGSIRSIPMTEDKPGHYVGNYTIRKGDDVARSRVAAILATPNGERFTQQSEQPVTIATGKPVVPVITYPTAGSLPSGQLVVKGRGTPNTLVHVQVNYKQSVFGVAALQGNAADTVVTVNRDGTWQTQPINLNGLIPGSATYTVTAYAENAANERSDTARVAFKLR